MCSLEMEPSGSRARIIVARDHILLAVITGHFQNTTSTPIMMSIQDMRDLAETLLEGADAIEARNHVPGEAPPVPGAYAGDPVSAGQPYPHVTVLNIDELRAAGMSEQVADVLFGRKVAEGTTFPDEVVTGVPGQGYQREGEDG